MNQDRETKGEQVMSTDIGIDLGTASILVYIKGKGVVLKEPSVVAFDRDTNKIKAIGEEARLMLGRTPGNIVAVRPLRQGVISDYTVTEKMLRYFIQKAMGKKSFRKPRISVCVPSGVTEVEKKAVEDAAKASEKLKEMDGKKPGEGDGKPGEGEPKPDGADMVANSTILSMLGLKADAKTEDVAASIMALKAGAPDTQAELLALKQRMQERDADEEVQKALKAGKITAAQSDWARSYALKDMEGFKGFVDKAPVVVPPGKLDLKDAPAASGSDEVDVAILKNMGVSMEDVKKYSKKED